MVLGGRAVSYVRGTPVALLGSLSPARNDPRSPGLSVPRRAYSTLIRRRAYPSRCRPIHPWVGLSIPRQAYPVLTRSWGVPKYRRQKRLLVSFSSFYLRLLLSLSLSLPPSLRICLSVSLSLSPSLSLTHKPVFDEASRCLIPGSKVSTSLRSDTATSSTSTP